MCFARKFETSLHEIECSGEVEIEAGNKVVVYNIAKVLLVKNISCHWLCDYESPFTPSQTAIYVKYPTVQDILNGPVRRRERSVFCESISFLLTPVTSVSKPRAK
jgi:hypothetical protein